MPWRHMGEWRYSSIILDLGTRWRWGISFMPLPLYPCGWSPGTYWIGGWVDPTVSLDDMEKRNQPSCSKYLGRHKDGKCVCKVYVSPTSLWRAVIMTVVEAGEILHWYKCVFPHNYKGNYIIFWQEPATDPYLETDESSPHPVSLRAILILSSHLWLRLPFRFLTKIVHTLFMFLSSTCSVHLIFLNSITIMSSYEDYK
jgi:hypothetical protein